MITPSAAAAITATTTIAITTTTTTVAMKPRRRLQHLLASQLGAMLKKKVGGSRVGVRARERAPVRVRVTAKGETSGRPTGSTVARLGNGRDRRKSFCARCVLCSGRVHHVRE